MNMNMNMNNCLHSTSNFVNKQLELEMVIRSLSNCVFMNVIHVS